MSDNYREIQQYLQRRLPKRFAKGGLSMPWHTPENLAFGATQHFKRGGRAEERDYQNQQMNDYFPETHPLAGPDRLNAVGLGALSDRRMPYLNFYDREQNPVDPFMLDFNYLNNGQSSYPYDRGIDHNKPELQDFAPPPQRYRHFEAGGSTDGGGNDPSNSGGNDPSNNDPGNSGGGDYGGGYSGGSGPSGGTIGDSGGYGGGSTGSGSGLGDAGGYGDAGSYGGGYGGDFSGGYGVGDGGFGIGDGGFGFGGGYGGGGNDGYGGGYGGDGSFGSATGDASGVVDGSNGPSGDAAFGSPAGDGMGLMGDGLSGLAASGDVGFGGAPSAPGAGLSGNSPDDGFGNASNVSFTDGADSLFSDSDAAATAAAAAAQASMAASISTNDDGLQWSGAVVDQPGTESEPIAMSFPSSPKDVGADYVEADGTPGIVVGGTATDKGGTGVAPGDFAGAPGSVSGMGSVAGAGGFGISGPSAPSVGDTGQTAWSGGSGIAEGYGSSANPGTGSVAGNPGGAAGGVGAVGGNTGTVDGTAADAAPAGPTGAGASGSLGDVAGGSSGLGVGNGAGSAAAPGGTSVGDITGSDTSGGVPDGVSGLPSVAGRQSGAVNSAPAYSVPNAAAMGSTAAVTNAFAPVGGITANGMAALIGTLTSESGFKSNSRGYSDPTNFGSLGMHQARGDRAASLLGALGIDPGLGRAAADEASRGVKNGPNQQALGKAMEGTAPQQLAHIAQEMAKAYPGVLQALQNPNLSVRQMSQILTEKFEVPAAPGSSKMAAEVAARANKADALARQLSGMPDAAVTSAPAPVAGSPESFQNAVPNSGSMFGTQGRGSTPGPQSSIMGDVGSLMASIASMFGPNSAQAAEAPGKMPGFAAQDVVGVQAMPSYGVSNDALYGTPDTLQLGSSAENRGAFGLGGVGRTVGDVGGFPGGGRGTASLAFDGADGFNFTGGSPPAAAAAGAPSPAQSVAPSPSPSYVPSSSLSPVTAPESIAPVAPPAAMPEGTKALPGVGRAAGTIANAAVGLVGGPLAGLANLGLGALAGYGMNGLVGGALQSGKGFTDPNVGIADNGGSTGAPIDLGHGMTGLPGSISGNPVVTVVDQHGTPVETVFLPRTYNGPPSDPYHYGQHSGGHNFYTYAASGGRIGALNHIKEMTRR